MKFRKSSVLEMTHFKSALYLGAGLAAFATLSMPAHAQDSNEDESRTLQTLSLIHI